MKYIPIITKSLLFAFTLFLLFGCYATTHRGPATLKPGQISGNVGYMNMKWSIPEESDVVYKLLTIDGRVGVLKFLDIGLIRTIDLEDYSNSATPDFEGFDVYWVDTKIQLSNIENKNYSPQFSLGYGFGDFLVDDDEEIKTFVNSLYLLLGMPTPIVTPYYSFRYEIADDKINWIPKWAWEEDSDDINKTHIIGFEINAIDFVKPVIEIGRVYQNDFSKGYNVITAGLNFYLDIPKLLSTKEPVVTE